ncbi:MAG TPA: four-carbon acid sugar kinase family protein [Clostridiales bacterium]|nr:four-carbon acid sugar kinase family protein [Clostridiales bacterium]
MQLVRRGYRTRVVLDSRGVLSDDLNYVLDTESRSLDSKEAYEKTRQMLKDIRLACFDFIIKKVDSTLRGNIAAETKAVDEAYKSELILLMPAYPDMNRTTKGGIHYLNGVRITETELAHDPKTPVREDRLNKIMEEFFDEPVRSITLEQIRNEDISFSGARIFCCDAQTNIDMQQVIGAALDTGKRILWVGTAALADNLLLRSTTVPPALAVVASVSDVARMQVRFAADAAEVVQVSIGDILLGDRSETHPVEEAVAFLHQGKDVLLISASTWSRDKLDSSIAAGKQAGMDAKAVSQRTQELMGSITKAVLKRTQVSGLFISGGDTAISVFEKLGAAGSQILGEVLAGIPLMRLSGGEFDGMKVITKAGAFGREDAISFCLRKLKEKL